MNTDRVFITYDINHKERLIYTKNNSEYIDLISKKHIDKEEINLNMLIPLKNIIYDWEYKDDMRRSKIIKLYERDRNIYLKLKNIYIGNLNKITEILSKDKINSTTELISYKAKLIKQNVLLYSLGIGYSYIDLLSNNEYYNENVCIKETNTIYVPNFKNNKSILLPFNNILSDSETYINEMKKNKVLEKYYKYISTNKNI